MNDITHIMNEDTVSTVTASSSPTPTATAEVEAVEIDIEMDLELFMFMNTFLDFNTLFLNQAKQDIAENM